MGELHSTWSDWFVREEIEEPDYEGNFRAPSDRRRVVDVAGDYEIGDFVVHVRNAHSSR